MLGGLLNVGEGQFAVLVGDIDRLVKAGNGEAGAYGRIGVVVLAVALIALLVGRGLGAW